MRVAFLLPRFPVLTETFISTQMEALLERGHEVGVYARVRPVAEEPVHEEVTRSGLLEKTVYLEAVPPNSLDPVPAAPLAPGSHDVLHAHFGPNARHYLFARAQCRAPLVVTFHGFDFSSAPIQHDLRMYDRLFEIVDRVTYNCERARRRLLDLGCPERSLRPLRMPVDLRSLRFRSRAVGSDEPVRILTVARLVEKKGLEVGLRALAIVRQRFPIRYDVIGGGPLGDRLDGLARELGLGDVVCFHGPRDSRYVRDRLAEAHLFMLPSMTAADGNEEGTPVSLVEAQACGLPVVSTRHGGIPEVVLDGRSGLLAPEGDAEPLARALEWLLDNRHVWPRFGAAGRAHVAATFDVAVTTDQLMAIYEDAVRAFQQ